MYCEYIVNILWRNEHNFVNDKRVLTTLYKMLSFVMCVLFTTFSLFLFVKYITFIIPLSKMSSITYNLLQNEIKMFEAVEDKKKFIYTKIL